jgi:hypothetical protein
MTFEIDPAAAVAVLATLALFGLGYNALVAEIGRHVPDHGYTAYLVAIGVVATLAGAALLIGLDSAIVVAGCFVASGLPMIVGSMARSLRQRSHDRARSADAISETLGLDHGN